MQSFLLHAERKPFSRYKGVLLTCFLFVLAPVCVSCDDEIKVYPQFEGAIVNLNRFSFVYVPSTGCVGARRFLWDDARIPTFLCEGPGDTLLCLARESVDTASTHGGKLYPRRAIAKYVAFDTTLLMVEKFADTQFHVHDLDYLPGAKWYLLLGKYSDNPFRGFVILDSEFSLLRDLTPIRERSFPSSNASIDKVFLVDSLKVIFDAFVGLDRRIYSLNLADSSITLLTRGRLKCISHDRNWVVLSRGDDWERLHFLMNTKNTENRELILDVAHGRQFCFSPDDRYLVYSRQTYDFYNRIKTYIYDMESGESYPTNYGARGPIVWVRDEDIQRFADTVSDKCSER